MQYKNILLTGGSGRLGQEIIKSGYFSGILAPSHEKMDITDQSSISRFFEKNDFGAIIHCAAIARMADCQSDPVKSIGTNVIGTSNLVIEALKLKEKKQGSARFIFISTDGVYSGARGNYSEKDAAIPYNNYGWTKLAGECAVNMLDNFCIIRTSFFDPGAIRFDESATDAYSSKMQIKGLVKAIHAMLNSSFIGTINIGDERKSDYERYKEFKPSLEPCEFKEILKQVSFSMAKDSSLDTSLWKKYKRQESAN